MTGVAHFLHAGAFGFYEDDYHYIANYLDADLAMVADLAARALVEWPQGRPLQSIVPPLLTVLLFPLGGLWPLYAVAFAVTAGSVVLFHRLALRTTASPEVALIGAIMFCLFPPDTTHPFLMHAFVLRLALLCTLAASWLYLAGRFRWSYALAFIGLALYETPFLVFLGLPLLTLDWTTPAGRRALLRHGLFCALLIAVTVAMRWLNGEERLAAAHGGLLDILIRLPERMLTGAAVSLRQMTYGPIKRIGGWDAVSLLMIIPAAPLFYLWLRPALNAETVLPTGAVADRDGCRAARPSFRRLLAASGLLLAVSYLLSFTHQPWFIYGRLTSVHLAASVGGSLLFALLAHRLLAAADARARNLVLPVLALHLAILLGYRHTIQVDFARSWQLQRWYWSNVVALTPDLDDGTVVLVAGESMPMTRYIRTYSWCDPLMLALLFRMPADWRHPPATLPLFQDTKLELDNGLPTAYFPDLAKRYRLLPDNVVLLRRQADHLSRDTHADAQLQGLTVSLRTQRLGIERWPERRPLYGLLIHPSFRRLAPR